MQGHIRHRLTAVTVAVALTLPAGTAFGQDPDPTPLERPTVVNLCVQVITKEPWSAADLIAAVIEGNTEASDDPSLVLLQVGEDGSCGDGAEPVTPAATQAPDDTVSDDAATFMVFLLVAYKLGGIDFDIDDRYAARQTADELDTLLTELRSLDVAPCFARVANEQIDAIEMMLRIAEAVAADDYSELLELQPEIEAVSENLGDMGRRLEEARAACGA